MEKYAFLMIDYETPEFIKKIQRQIPESELYLPDDPDSPWKYGLETETHVTVAACLDNDVDLDILKKYLKPLESYKLMIKDVSVFRNAYFDVLKCSVDCDNLFKTNNAISDDFELHTEFTEYHPHITIAYMRKGMADKYRRHIMKEPVFIHPLCFTLSRFNGDMPESVRFV